MKKKTLKKYKSGAPVAIDVKKTRKQALTDALPSAVFLKKKQNIEKNIQKYKDLYATEMQKEIPEPVQAKIYKDRIRKYEWELRTLLANQPQTGLDVAEPQPILPPEIPPTVSDTPLPEPELQPTEPELQPTEPELQPTEPELQPTEPELQPTEPELQPTEPELQPTEPELQPTEPELQPTEPELQPTEPELQPPEDIEVSPTEEPKETEETEETEEEQINPQLLEENPEPITELEEPAQDASEKQINQYKKQLELQQTKEEGQTQPEEMDYLYPTHNDPHFQSKIAQRKEFYDNQYLDEPADIKQQSELLCKAEFEHLPHQVFVRNFLSPQTPYRSLLLYHQLGTGKTCTAIGVCEEFRETMKQIGTSKQQRIIIVGSVNVKSNFRKQLFDEDKIRSIAKENGGNFDYQDIQLCTASALLKEINPMNIQGLSLETVIQQVANLIDKYYSFFGYQSLANYIDRNIKFKASDVQKKEYTESYLKQYRIDKIRQHFNGRLFVIDEAHNLRITSDNGDENSKKTSMLLLEIAQYAENVRFLLLTATPMYNSPEEVLWWSNLLNTNDRRSTITRSEVFTAASTNAEDTTDIFKPKDPSKPQLEGGRELLQRKLVGYVSYVRGENPFSFPYRIYPMQFLTDESEILAHTFHDQNRPVVQMNGRPIENPLQNIPVYLTQLERSSYQYIMYDLCIKYLRQHTFTQKDKFGNQMERIGFEEMGGFGYTLLQIPVECLDIVFPSVSKNQLTSESVQGGALPGIGAGTNNPITPDMSDDEDDDDDDEEQTPEADEEGEEEQKEKERYKILRDDPEWIQKKNFLMNSIGQLGMRNTFTLKSVKVGSNTQKTQYEYKPEIMKQFGRFLSPENLPQYSRKFAEIQQRILRSTGVVMVYSEYIDGGVIPFALALEELGFERHVPKNSRFTSTLFNPQSPNFSQIQKRDALTMKPHNDPLFQTGTATFNQAKYALITGNMSFSPNNPADIATITSPENKYGSLVKVVLITRAASEGVDFKFLRQVHILEPWYNMNRIEQIIGRGVRNNSHCMLPFEERNVEIYLHGTLLPAPATPVLPVAPEPTEPTEPTEPKENIPQPLEPVVSVSSETKEEDEKENAPSIEQTGGADALQPPLPSEEAADVYIYRVAERKAKKIGQITRLLKETAVDCILNIRQTKFTVQDLETIAANQNLSITLSTDQKQIVYKVGDRPFTDLCDYMDNCAFQCADTKQITAEQVATQTYQYSHIKTNRPMIMKRIRQLFREEMVYTGKQLVKLIQGAKEYPEVQIYDTLSYFLQNDNELLTDKYGRSGRLSNHGSYYAFLPLELQDTRASLLERQRPIDYKRPYLTFEPMDAIQEATEETIAQKPTTAAEKPTAEQAPMFEQQNIQQLFEQSLQKVSHWMSYSSTTTPMRTAETEEDKQIKAWFRSIPAAKNIMEYLFNNYLSHTTEQPTDEQYYQYSLYHALDLLSTDEKLSLAYVVFSQPKETETFLSSSERTTPLFQSIASYFQSRFLQGKDKQTALVLANYNPKTNLSTNQYWSMTLEPTEENQPKHLGWFPVSETDVPVFFQQAFQAQFEVPVRQIHYKFGFMRPFLSKGKIQTGEVVLNIKNLNQKTRNNKGARVDQALGQDLRTHIQNILAIPTAIELPVAIQKITSILGLSVVLEFALRWKDRRPNSSTAMSSTTVVAKKYFFTLEEAIANRVDKLFCQIDGAMNVVSCDQ